jgi:hypothetical protein
MLILFLIFALCKKYINAAKININAHKTKLILKYVTVISKPRFIVGI